MPCLSQDEDAVGTGYTSIKKRGLLARSMSVLMIIVGCLPMEAACSKKNEGTVEMSRKLTSLVFAKQ